jgi:peptidoglycan/LPS O-acetylase OafA/YrhL
MSATTHVTATASGATLPAAEHPNRLRALWNVVTGALGAVLGLAPHVLHHIGFLAGTAIVAGTAGTVLFGAIGLIASVPFLLRLYRRFGSWRAPAIGLVVFAAMFSLSAFLIGPAISGGTDSPAPSTPGVILDEHGH